MNGGTVTNRRRTRHAWWLVSLTAAMIVLFTSAYVYYKGDTLLMKRLYVSKVEGELANVGFSTEVFTEDDIAALPDPVQRFFRYSGYLGKRKMSTAKIVFEDVDFISNGKTLKLTSEQYNFVTKPARVVYLNSKVMGIIPFEGVDRYQNGEGFMTGKLMKLIPLFNVTGPEMNQSALVTFLAEALVVPSSALQDYIEWQELDSNRAKATMSYGGIQAEGVFTFNDEGQFVQFETNDRYMDKGHGVAENVKWVAEVADYTERADGIKVPTRMRAIWKLAEGDLVYFDGHLVNIYFDAN